MTGRVYVNLLEVIIYFKNTTKNNSCRWYPSTGDLPMFETAPRRISVIQAVDVGDEKSPVRHVGLRVCPNHGENLCFFSASVKLSYSGDVSALTSRLRIINMAFAETQKHRVVMVMVQVFSFNGYMVSNHSDMFLETTT